MRPLVVFAALALSGCTFGLGDYDVESGPRDYGEGDVSAEVDATEPEADEPVERAPAPTTKSSTPTERSTQRATVARPPSRLRP